jgi:hypothetical protein
MNRSGGEPGGGRFNYPHISSEAHGGKKSLPETDSHEGLEHFHLVEPDDIVEEVLEPLPPIFNVEKKKGPPPPPRSKKHPRKELPVEFTAEKRPGFSPDVISKLSERIIDSYQKEATKKGSDVRRMSGRTWDRYVAPTTPASQLNPIERKRGGPPPDKVEPRVRANPLELLREAGITEAKDNASLRKQVENELLEIQEKLDKIDFSHHLEVGTEVLSRKEALIKLLNLLPTESSATTPDLVTLLAEQRKESEKLSKQERQKRLAEKHKEDEAYREPVLQRVEAELTSLVVGLEGISMGRHQKKPKEEPKKELPPEKPGFLKRLFGGKKTSESDLNQKSTEQLSPLVEPPPFKSINELLESTGVDLLKNPKVFKTFEEMLENLNSNLDFTSRQIDRYLNASPDIKIKTLADVIGLPRELKRFVIEQEALSRAMVIIENYKTPDAITKFPERATQLISRTQVFQTIRETIATRQLQTIQVNKAA